jgi:hypothetical protein
MDPGERRRSHPAPVASAPSTSHDPCARAQLRQRPVRLLTQAVIGGHGIDFPMPWVIRYVWSWSLPACFFSAAGLSILGPNGEAR